MMILESGLVERGLQSGNASLCDRPEVDSACNKSVISRVKKYRVYGINM